jgi:hypothetical protein
MMGDRTIFDHILETNSKFTGFEIVPVEFDELFFTLSLNVEDKIVHIRSIQHDLEDGHPYVCLSQVHADAERYFSYQDATTAVKILKQQNFLLHEHIHVEEVFVNPKLSK